jgi:hypothetical protein
MDAKRKVDGINALTQNIQENKSNAIIMVNTDQREAKLGETSCRSPTRYKHYMQPKMENDQEESALSEKIDMFNEIGPFLTHLPQFVDTAKYFFRGTQSKLKKLG